MRKPSQDLIDLVKQVAEVLNTTPNPKIMKAFMAAHIWKYTEEPTLKDERRTVRQKLFREASYENPFKIAAESYDVFLNERDPDKAEEDWKDLWSFMDQGIKNNPLEPREFKNLLTAAVISSHVFNNLAFDRIFADPVIDSTKVEEAWEKTCFYADNLAKTKPSLAKKFIINMSSKTLNSAALGIILLEDIQAKLDQYDLLAQKKTAVYTKTAQARRDDAALNKRKAGNKPLQL